MNLLNHHAHIFNGNNGVKVAIKNLQQIFCKDNGCQYCYTCKKINEKNFHSILWLAQNNLYKISDLEEIFEKIKFQLDEDQRFFFIIENAQNLNDFCSNKILKILEEPHKGYYFILITNNLEQILPTIKSRCLISETKSNNENIENEILIFFKNKACTPSEFLNFLYKNNIDEIKTKEILEEILTYWSKELKTNPSQENLKIFNLIKQQFEKFPMPGGSKIFWRNFYTKFKLLFLE